MQYVQKKCSISLCNLSEKSFSSVYAICQKKVFYQFMQWICQKKVFYQFMQYFRKCVLSNYVIWKKSVPSLSDYAICQKKMFYQHYQSMLFVGSGQIAQIVINLN